MLKLYKTSFVYWILRVYTNFLFKRWFSSVEINGLSNVPDKGAVIFAPNHQNALMDAMALLYSSPRPVVFLARADLFKRKFISRILHFLKIMPAYRMKDGIQNLKKNDLSFEKAVEVLSHREFFCLMPEGGQREKRRLRPLVKGMFRIAFSAQNKLENGETVKIIPVGIDYGNYSKSGSHLVVSFGRPIKVAEYMNLYQENVPGAQNKIRNELFKRMSPLMLDIQSEEYYDAFYVASYLCNYNVLLEKGWEDNETNRLAARKVIVEKLSELEASGDDDLKLLADNCEAWQKRNKDVAFAAKVKEYGRSFDFDLAVSLFYLICALPLFIYSFVFNGLQYSLIKIISRKARGTGFESTFKFSLAVIFIPVFYAIFAFVILPYMGSMAMKAAFLASLPLSFFFMLKYFWRFKFVKERLKNVMFKDEQAERIIEFMDKVIKE